MPNIQVWIPLTGRVDSLTPVTHQDGRVEDKGKGDVDFLPLHEIVPIKSSTPITTSWLDVDWDERQVFVDIEADQPWLDALETMIPGAKLNTGQRTALVAQVNSHRQGRRAVDPSGYLTPDVTPLDFAPGVSPSGPP